MSKIIRIKEAKLNTRHMFEDESQRDEDYPLWQKIAEYMNGETAFVAESQASDGEYVLLGLKDQEKNKELHYLMEQDSVTGVYVNDREAFDKDWDSEEYESGGCFYLEPQYLIFEPEEDT